MTLWHPQPRCIRARFISRPMLAEGDCLDLNARVIDEARAFGGGARGGILGEILAEYGVHFRELVKVLHVDGHLHDLLQRRAARTQDCFEVLADLPRFGTYAAGGQLARARVVAELTGDEDPFACLDPLGEGYAGRRHIGGVNYVLIHALTPSGRTL